MSNATDECRNFHVKRVEEATAKQMETPAEIPVKLRAMLCDYKDYALVLAAANRIELLEAAMRIIVDATPEKDDGSLAADIRRIALQATP